MKTDNIFYPYKSRRTVVYGKSAMAASSNTYATIAGTDIMKAGGNCVDAALAMAMVHVVVEPTGNGLGSDAFAIVSMDGKLYGLNASGPAPVDLKMQKLKDLGYNSIPQTGPLSVDVPGAVGGWISLHERFGKLSLEEIAAPAIKLAEEGYPVSPTISQLWKAQVEKYSKFKDDPAYKGFFDTFTINGRAPYSGEVVKLKDLAESLREIVKTNGESFYRGKLAKAISDYVREKGGLLTTEDLSSYKPEWVEPLSVNYRGIDVWELPPNGHGITVLMALKILNKFDFSHMTEEEKTHYAIEALKSAYVDAKEYVAEPERMRPHFRELLKEDYLTLRKNQLEEKALDPKVGTPGEGSTIYLAAADKDENMISFIQSNYMGFGSGVVVEKTGISLNNRAHNFDFDDTRPNGLVGGTRPYHTIIPGFLTQDGKALGPFGVMGGFMQPQGHLQVLIRMIDDGLNPQAALDAPRWQWIKGKKVEIEEDYESNIVKDLKKREHEIDLVSDRTDMGRGQIILREKGVYLGGTEPRTDGCVLGI
ncbi:gamma-glutamyltransferase family protein [Peptoniphilus catoniae]|uniref:gamma-glutamyltransferase family protein n=1 Tax=Peptoniphilus catoniae TaxID=1660341 RepID=UPI0031FDE354